MTFKAKIVANELTNTDVTAVSLVKHASTRAPIKIMKTEGVELAPQLGAGPVKTAIDTVFGNSAEADVSFIAVKKGDNTPSIIKKMEAAGFATDNSEEHGDVTIYKQAGYVDEVGSMITLNPEVAVGLSQVIKGFDPWPMSTNFDDNVNSAAFFPGFYEATYSLGDTISNVLYEALSKSEAQTGIADALSAFSKHVKGLVKSIPDSVIKMELSLSHEFASSILSTDKTDLTTEDKTVNKAEQNIKETSPGDLAGLNSVVKADDPKKVVDANATPTADDTVVKTDTKAADDTVQPVAPEIKTRMAKQQKADEILDVEISYFLDGDGNEVETKRVVKTASTGDATLDAIAALGNKIEAQLNDLGTRVSGVEKAQTDTLAAVDTVTEVAKNTVVHRSLGDLDQSLSTTNQKPAPVEVEKSENDIWDGSLKAFDL